MSSTSQSIEERDRELFDSIAGAYAYKDRISYCRRMRKLRLTQTLKRVKKPMGNVLELGCGAGFAAEYLEGMYENFVGVDYSKELIDLAKKYHQRPHVTFLAEDIKQYSPRDKFDVIFMIGVLHHIPDAAAAVAKCKDFLAPGGVVLANEPQRGNPIVGIMRKARKLVDSRYSDDQIEYSRVELEKLFDDAGFEVDSFPQGVLSTPLAEAPVLPQVLGGPISALLNGIDPILEAALPKALSALTWNVVVEAKVP